MVKEYVKKGIEYRQKSNGEIEISIALKPLQVKGLSIKKNFCRIST